MAIFKKSLSVLLTLVIIASFCTMAISVSAEGLTLNDFNIIEGTGANVSYIVDDPVVEGEKAFRITTNGKRPNLKLASPSDNTTALVLTAGTTYTVKLDYYFKADTVNPEFALYYGKDPKTNGQRTAVSSVTVNGFSTDTIGDGKWHTAAFTFKAVNKTGGGATLDNLFLTYYSTGKVNGYIKNISVVTETSTGWKETTNLLGYFGDDNKADPVYFDGIGKRAAAMMNSYIDSDGNAVFVPNQDLIKVVNNTQTTLANYDYINVIDSTASNITGVNDALWNIYFNIKYKVTQLGEGGAAAIGIGRASNTASTTVCFNSIKITKTSDDWQYYTAPIKATGNGHALRIYLGGKDAHIAIDKVEIVYCGKATSHMAVAKYNDNGEISIDLVYGGVDVLKKGENAENLALGEQFLGWYKDANFETEFTQYAEINRSSASGLTNVLYAKYPTIIIDNFAMLGSYSTSAGFSSSGASFTGDALKLNGNSSHGAVLPAYDDAKLKYAKFTVGKTYHIKIYYDSVTTSNNKNTNINLIRGDGYASGGKRSGSPILESDISPITEAGVISSNVKYTNYQSVQNIIIRPHNDSNLTVTAVIDKITITDISLLESAKDKQMVSEGSIRYEKSSAEKYTSAGVRYKGRISAEYRDMASEIGFVAVPTSNLNGLSFSEYLSLADNVAISGAVKADGIEEIVYDEYTDFYGRMYYDYQLIVTGLTRKGVATNLLNTDITVCMYSIVDGVTTYSDTISYSYNYVSELSKLYKADKITDGADIRIMSYNIYATYGDVDARYPNIVKTVNNYKPDIIGIQECHAISHDTLMSDLLGEYNIIGKRLTGKTALCYTPILYRKDKYTVIESGAQMLRSRPSSGNGTKSYTWAVLEDNLSGKRFIITNLHGAIVTAELAESTGMSNSVEGAEMREDNILEIYEKIQELKLIYGDIPTFSTGDYNFNSNSKAYADGISLGFKDSANTAEFIKDSGIKSHHSTVGVMPSAGLPIDHIFITPSTSVVTYDIVTDQIALNSSDHCPVYVDAKLDSVVND